MHGDAGRPEKAREVLEDEGVPDAGVGAVRVGVGELHVEEDRVEEGQERRREGLPPSKRALTCTAPSAVSRR